MVCSNRESLLMHLYLIKLLFSGCLGGVVFSTGVNVDAKVVVDFVARCVQLVCYGFFAAREE